MILKTPIRIGSLTLQNRLVLPPMATEKSAGGAVSDELIRYYDEITRGGFLGLAITEHSFVRQEGKSSPNQVSIASDDAIPGFRAIAETIHKNGVPVIAQISHAGSAAREQVTGFPPAAPSAVPHPNAKEPVVPREMTAADIAQITDCFVQAARRAMAAGFDGVEVHSAHGYLLDQFYSPLTNRRTDAYTGATLAGRTRLHTEILRAVRSEIGPDAVLCLRWGASDYTDGGASIEEVPEAARIFAAAGLDLLSISGGMCGTGRPGHPEPGWFAELARAAKDAAGVPVLLTGGVTNAAEAETLLTAGDADLIGVGRAILRDPSLPGRMLA